MSEGVGFTFEFKDQAEVRAAMKEVRGTRYSWRREHLVVEFGKLLVYAIPIMLFVSGTVGEVGLVMFIAGVFAWRGYEKLLLPVVIRLVFSDGDKPKKFPGRLLLDQRGVWAIGSDCTVQHGWRSVSEVERHDRGIVIRLGPYCVYPVPKRKLPEGAHFDEFVNCIVGWQETAK